VRTVAVFTLIALFAVVLQTTVLPLLRVGRATPDLLLIICVYLGLHQHSVFGALGAFVLGYLQDAFSGGVIGLNAFGMCLVFAIVYLTSRRLWVDNALSKVVVVFLASVVKTTAILALVTVFMSVEGLWRTILSYLLIDATLAAVLSPAVFAVLSRTQLLAQVEEE
jgi:rod shape-determining protein MreD